MSTDNHTPDIAERLNRLERKNRRLTVLAALPWLILVVVVLTAQSSMKEGKIVASSVVVKDSAGIVRASLGMKGKDAELQMFDSNGALAASLDSAGMLILSETGKTRGTAVLVGHLLGFYKGLTMISQLSVDGLALHRTNGKTLAGIRVDNGHARVFVADPSGYETIMGWMPLEQPDSGETVERSAASLIMANPKRQVIWKAP